ncbi:hypothetical protein RND81_07G194800 [Saponaria officinalis]|uniref:BHLH domain-containing protein n=1 Tax=Saponaria officinalis TaxID=3572 RepID=A0AAW1JQ92_SAPOF
MGHLESVLELLRPLVLGSNSWDYCVVWKLGDDPSRFLEWIGCCCNGGGNPEVGNKRKNREKNVSISACKDANFVHPANTKSCEALAKLPPFMPLYSGVHGEVVISCQPRWINIAHAADSKASTEEFEGTRVLIPVYGGLVELFSTEHISEDESVIQYVQSQYNSSEIETMSNFDRPYMNPFLEKTLETCLSSLTQTFISINHTHSGTALVGSSPDSTPCNSVSQAMPKEVSDGNQNTGKKQCKSKNLWTERNRRKRISDGMLTLRSIVPKITKMHKAATLSDAVDYIKELENETRNLLDELENSDKNTDDLKSTSLISSNREQFTSALPKSPLSQARVDVNQLGDGKHLLRVVLQQSPGVFTKLLEALESLDVLIVDVNATVCNGTMSSNIIVQTNNKEVQETDLRDCLMLMMA